MNLTKKTFPKNNGTNAKTAAQKTGDKKKKPKLQKKKNKKIHKKQKNEEYKIKNNKKMQKKNFQTQKFGVKILHLSSF